MSDNIQADHGKIEQCILTKELKQLSVSLYNFASCTAQIQQLVAQVGGPKDTQAKRKTLYAMQQFE